MFERIRRAFGGGAATVGEPPRPRVDVRDQVLRLSIPERAFVPEHVVAKRVRREGAFVSAAVLAAKAKQFDDGLYAAVELAAQQGLGRFRGKRGLLDALVERLASDGEARAVLEAAAVLGGIRTGASARADAVKTEFVASELRSKPLGLYGWTEALKRIFRQDRLLQTDMGEAADVMDVVRSLHSDAALREAYEQNLRLVERLTNPLACEDLRASLRALDEGQTPRLGRGVAFSPPSRAHETELVKRLYRNSPIPNGFDLAAELARAIRAGAIDLAPKPESGWYDVQTWALETLAAPDRAPEAAKLVLDETYRAHLEKLFRAILTATRETHVKQLEVPMAGCAPGLVKAIVRPQLTVEPLPTFYARRAESYRFVRALLADAFGDASLRAMHRQRASGPVAATLDDDLAWMIRLFEGAAVTANTELGLPTSGDMAAFAAWATGEDDPDVDVDVRLMVPVYFDQERRKTKVWMILGWTEDWMRASFERPPRVELVGGAPAEVEFADASFPLANLVMIEALVSRVLDRDEFRAHCDRYVTPAAIVAALA